MIVSILQLMGFGKSKPVHSRASENSELVHPQANSARRTDVKAKVGSPKAAAKVVAKAVKSKLVVKAALKKPGKVAAKPVAKVVVKAKSQVKPKVKPKASVAKPKVNSKVAAKVSPSALKKTVLKSPAKAPNKPASKAIPKPVAKVAPKAIAKATPKAAGKTTKPKSADKAAAKNVTEKVIEVLKRKAASPAKAIAAPAPVIVAPSPAQPVTAAVLTPKAGRPSSRLAQLTVVGMAQSVASTAAKSSYLQTVALPVIVPSLTMAPKKDPKLANNWKTKPVEQMTDPELMAMPDAEYMNEKQMAVFRLKLSVLKQDILNSASDTTEHLREDTVVVPDPADRATIEEEHALELRTRDRERKLLKKIEQSINRIDAGDYGYCDETGEPIGVGRLLARPTATLSLEAQQRRELKQKMFGD
jgi:DnaK suppressor protein